MERRLIGICAVIAQGMGWGLIALGDGRTDGPRTIAIALVALGTLGLIVWAVATGVVLGMREFRDERNPSGDLGHSRR